MKIGFTKAYRKELKSDIWKMPPMYQRVFYYLRQSAVWKPESFPTKKKFKIALNPGQLITSFSIIADGVSWYEYGVKRTPNKKIISDILWWLESNDMITVESNRHGTFINITNWDTYNHNENEEVTPKKRQKVTPKKRTVDTLKEDKEDKEDKNKTLPDSDESGLKNKQEFYETKRGRKLTGKRLESFMKFWDAFKFKNGKADAADSWLNIPVLTDKLVDDIVNAAKLEAQRRPDIIAKGNTPKWAQGWLSGKRWEDEGYQEHIKTKTTIFKVDNYE